MRKLIVVVALALLGGVDPVAAQDKDKDKDKAQQPGSGAEAAEVVTKVFKAVDPRAAYQAMGTKEQERFKKEARSASFSIEDQSSEATESVAGRSCWKGQARGAGKNAIGKTLYTYWVSGTWCASGGRVTSASFSSADGETKTPGWRHDGVKSKGKDVIKNLGRVWAKQRFILGIGGWDIQTVDVCLRLSGTANGKISAQSVCGGF